MDGKKIGKIALSVLTVGVTITVVYHGIKAVKKHLAKKKEAKEIADKKELDLKNEETKKK